MHDGSKPNVRIEFVKIEGKLKYVVGDYDYVYHFLSFWVRAALSDVHVAPWVLGNSNGNVFPWNVVGDYIVFAFNGLM